MAGNNRQSGLQKIGAFFKDIFNENTKNERSFTKWLAEQNPSNTVTPSNTDNRQNGTRTGGIGRVFSRSRSISPAAVKPIVADNDARLKEFTEKYLLKSFGGQPVNTSGVDRIIICTRQNPHPYFRELGITVKLVYETRVRDFDRKLFQILSSDGTILKEVDVSNYDIRFSEDGRVLVDSLEEPRSSHTNSMLPSAPPSPEPTETDDNHNMRNISTSTAHSNVNQENETDNTDNRCHTCFMIFADVMSLGDREKHINEHYSNDLE